MMLHEKRRHGSLAALAVQAGVALVCLVATSGNSSAQFFDDRFPLFERRMFESSRPAPPADNSKAPAPRKADRAESSASKTVLVLGDSMADWLGYGLELAYQDSQDFSVVRRIRTWSSLIGNDNRHELRNKNNVDWPVLAKEILAAEQPKFIVMMIGLSDRQPIRERPKAPPEAKAQDKPADGKVADKPKESPKDATEAAKKPEPVDDELAPATPSIIAAEEKRGGGSYEFRTDKWSDLYIKRIDEMIAVLKSKGVPVLWVGLPSIRGPKATADMAYLDDLFRSRAEKAGITYVDVWDGFVDDGGRFTVQGPDVEGQYRRLRPADGIHFTSFGARKLAHYVDREIQHALTPTGPFAISIPVEPEPKPTAAPSGNATARPMVGPVIPLNAINVGASEDQLLGGGGGSGARQTINDALASRVLVKGEAQLVPAGRADDFIWPRRSPAAVGADPVVATTTLPLTPMLAERPAAPKQQVPQQSASAAPQEPTTRRRHTSRQPQVFGQMQRAEPRPSSPPPFFFFFGR